MIPDPRERPTLSVEEAGAIVGLGRSSAYVEASRYLRTDGRHGLPVIAFGRRLLVPTARLLDMLGLAPVEARSSSGAEEQSATHVSVGGSGGS